VGRCIGVATQDTCYDGGSSGFSILNHCLTDQCSSDAPCPFGYACTPEGYGDVRHCIEAACQRDADCTAEPGGVCIEHGGDCCYVPHVNGGTRQERLICVYPSDECLTAYDCPSIDGIQ